MLFVYAKLITVAWVMARVYSHSVNTGHRKAFQELKYRKFMAVLFALDGLSIATDMPVRKILNQIGLASLGIHEGHSN